MGIFCSVLVKVRSAVGLAMLMFSVFGPGLTAMSATQAADFSIANGPKFSCDLPNMAHKFTADFDPANHVLMVMAAGVAGLKKVERVAGRLKAWGAQDFRMIGRTQERQRGYVVDLGEMILVTLRGTSASGEFFSNLRFMQRELSHYSLPGKAHKGFVKEFASIKNEIWQALNEMNGIDRKPIVVNGHSLGGAMGLLTAVLLVNDGWNVQSVYLSATPALGDDKLSYYIDERLGGKIYTLVMKDDPINFVPASAENSAYFASLNGAGFEDVVAHGIDKANYAPNPGHLTVFDEYDLSLGQDSAEVALDFWRSVTPDQSLLALPIVYARKFKNHKIKYYVCRYGQLL